MSGERRVDHMPRHELEAEVLRLRAARIDVQVRAFHDLMGIENRAELGVPPDEVVRLRLRLVLEEAFEFLEATVAETEREDVRETREILLDVCSFVRLSPDLVEIADALADLDYVVAGTRLAFGIPGQAVADEVHRSNMAKAPGGVVLRDQRGKVTKPPGWTPPDVAKALGIKP